MTDNRTDAPADAEALRQETADAAPEVAEHDAAAARIAELENQLADAKQQTLYAQADIRTSVVAPRRTSPTRAPTPRPISRATSCRSPTIWRAACR